MIQYLYQRKTGLWNPAFSLKQLSLISCLLLCGCNPSSEIKTEKDFLLGQDRCSAKIRRIKPERNADDAALTFKMEPGTPLKAKGILKIAQAGKRDYTLNPSESLILKIDGNDYPLEVIHSLKDPLEEIEQYNVALPSGGSLMLGRVKEVTRRSITFLLSQQLMDKIILATRVSFRIDSPSKEGYPIVIPFTQENQDTLQKFKITCTPKA
ncbi:hypothetical protein [Candidatus Odyssella thessalonicensis]|uniref:hypothetical protein n=1 Tax=Candidatus Odyssella thessalonicensis TaxID=84647 RepID=UPI000225AF8C|nr:hypothetical protein [Candidatus Odyssella thessalonicensis]